MLVARRDNWIGKYRERFPGAVDDEWLHLEGGLLTASSGIFLVAGNQHSVCVDARQQIVTRLPLHRGTHSLFKHTQDAL